MSSHADPSARTTVLVTGGTGYLASWIIAELLRRGHAVRTTVRSLARVDQVRAAISERTSADTLAFAQADLLEDDGWDAAIAGVDYVVHTASPLGTDRSQDLVRTAREGIKRVLKASADAGVRRVVLTSSANAAVSGHDHDLVDETFWGETTGKPADAYARSKVLSELDAWSFAESSDSGLELTTVLPGLIQGPFLGQTTEGSAAEITGRLLAGKMPALPNIGWGIVDVRDVAELHVRAMTAPGAAGERFLAVGDFLWWHEIAEILRAELGDEASKVSTRKLPNVIVRLGARVNSDMAMIAAMLGQNTRVDSSKAERLLGWRTRPAKESVVDAARSLIEHKAAG
jgi:nucleoside-diphosphate-sugar epimerase